MINAAAGALVIAAGLGGADDFDIGTFMKAFGPTGNVRAFNPTGNYTGRDFIDVRRSRIAFRGF